MSGGGYGMGVDEYKAGDMERKGMRSNIVEDSNDNKIIISQDNKIIIKSNRRII